MREEEDRSYRSRIFTIDVMRVAHAYSACKMMHIRRFKCDFCSFRSNSGLSHVIAHRIDAHNMKRNHLMNICVLSIIDFEKFKKYIWG